MNVIINGRAVDLLPAKPSLKDCPRVPEGSEADYVFVTNMDIGQYNTKYLDPTLCYIGAPQCGQSEDAHYGVYYHKDHQGINLKKLAEDQLAEVRRLLGVIAK